MASMPKVSVIIPTFNRAKLVCRAIDSVLVQSYSNIECVVIDDASTDNTFNILKDRYGSKIHVIRNKRNMDKSYSRNKGVIETDADYVCFLDSDDILTKDSIQKRVECILDKDDCSASFGLRLDIVKGKVRKSCNNFWGSLKKGDIITLEQYLNNKNWLSTNSFLIPRNTMLKYGMFNEKLYNQEDVELFIRLLLNIKFYFCGTVVTHIFNDADHRARNNFKKIIEQGTMLSASLESNPDVVRKLGNRLEKIKQLEYIEILSALYHSGRYSEFRNMFLSGLSKGVSPKNFKFYRRLVLSYFRSGGCP